MRVAAFDCGTNAIRLLVADVHDGGADEVLREMRIVRLGEGVDETGCFSPQALERTFAACREYAGIVTQHGVQAMRFAATSATRDAGNRQFFIDGVTSILGVAPEVITGRQEAELSFTGAVLGLPDVPRPALVVDIGGGSTEFVLGDTEPTHTVSVDMGCVRMTERHVRHDPLTPAELAAIRADVDQLIAFAGQHVPFADASSLIGLAGSVTTVAAMALGLSTYDPLRIHGARISRDDVDAVTMELAAMTAAQRAALPFMHPGRVDVIASGATILAAIMAATGAEQVVASEHDLLDGLVVSLG